jgi:hypothetical protein
MNKKFLLVALFSLIGAPSALATYEGNPVHVPVGGTGDSSLTQYGLMLGDGTGPVSVLSPSSSTAFPLVSSGSSADPSWSLLGVAGGGSGNSSFTAYSLLAGGATSTGALQQISGLGTTGQVLVSNGSGALPTWQTVTSSTQTYWDGYFANSTTFTMTSSTSYADFTSSSSVSLSTANSNNLTCTSHGSNIPGVDCTLPQTGGVWVCASISALSTGTGTAALFALTDGSNNLISHGAGQNQFVSGDNLATTLCGAYTASSTSVTFKIRAASGGSHSLEIESASGVDTPLEFSVTMIPGGGGNVASNASGTEHIERVTFNGGGSATPCSSSPCTIASQSGSWVSSVTWNSTGSYTINIPVGEFSATPTCTCTADENGTGYNCQGIQNVQTSTSVTVYIYDKTQTLQNGMAQVICMGPH